MPRAVLLSACSFLAMTGFALAATPIPAFTPPPAPKPVSPPPLMKPPAALMKAQSGTAAHPGASPTSGTHAAMGSHEPRTGGSKTGGSTTGKLALPHVRVPKSEPAQPKTRIGTVEKRNGSVFAPKREPAQPKTRIGTVEKPRAGGTKQGKLSGVNGISVPAKAIGAGLVGGAVGLASSGSAGKTAPAAISAIGTSPQLTILPASVSGVRSTGQATAAPQIASPLIAVTPIALDSTKAPANTVSVESSASSIKVADGGTAASPTLPPASPTLVPINPKTGQLSTLAVLPSTIVTQSQVLMILPPTTILIAPPINQPNQILTLANPTLIPGTSTVPAGGQAVVQVPSQPAVSDPMSSIPKPAATPIPTTVNSQALLGGPGEWLVPFPTGLGISAGVQYSIMSTSKTPPTAQQIADYYTKQLSGDSASQLSMLQSTPSIFSSNIATAAINNLAATQTYIGKVYSTYGAMSQAQVSAIAKAYPNSVDGQIAAAVAPLISPPNTFPPIQVINTPNPPPPPRNNLCFKDSMGCLLQPQVPPAPLQMAETVIAAVVVAPVSIVAAIAVAPALLSAGAVAVAAGTVVVGTTVGVVAAGGLSAQAIIGFLDS